MRIRKTGNGLTVTAIAGTYVVVLGIDMAPAATAGLLGFAIRRTDPTEDESYWLQGMRTFEASYPNPPDGALVSTHEHPIQDFLWSDFTAKPGRNYSYEVVPVRGKPKKLQYGASVAVDVTTEAEEVDPALAGAGPAHSIYFNRGVIGSQAYARKWKVAPNKLVGPEHDEAMQWLSRGLDEAILKFIGQADSARFGLRAAVYEFDYEPVIAAFQKAQEQCGNVKIVYDARVAVSRQGVPDKDQQSRVAEVDRLLQKYGLTAVATPRRTNPSYIAHNKFIVLLQDGEPVAVWTGSTNFTESGIYGQSNVGHMVRDEALAKKYLDYWMALAKDPTNDVLKDANETATSTLVDVPPPSGVTPLFSPRHGLGQLNWYGSAMQAANLMTCFTGAFGINKVFLDVFAQDRDYLRYVFLEKWGVNANTAEATEKVLGKDHDIQVAVGTTLPADALYHWLGEQGNTLSKNVKYTHTKFMLVDPLGADPIVVSGSANFSDASTADNDENMLVIRGDKRVADIYVGEFMRLWRHYNFRYIVTTVDVQSGEPRHNYLAPDASWAAPFFKPGSVKLKRRQAFGPDPDVS